MIEPFIILMARAQAKAAADLRELRGQRPRLPFRCALVLMIFNAYAFGDHVSDPQAFVLRCRRLGFMARKLRGDHFSFEAWPLPRVSGPS